MTGHVFSSVAMAAGLAALGCSSSTVNDSGATGGAGSGGAAGASGASSGGAGGGSAGGGAGQDASAGAGGALIWCSAVKDCAALCGALQPVCPKIGDVCRCNTGDCATGKTDVCPAGMTCGSNYSCYPDGDVALGQACSWPTKRCISGLVCDSANEIVDGSHNFICRRPCKKASPPAGCSCQSSDPVDGWCK